MRGFAKTDVGKAREMNQDSYYVLPCLLMIILLQPLQEIIPFKLFQRLLKVLPQKEACQVICVL